MTAEEEDAANMAELSRLRGEMWEADRQAALEVLREMTVESDRPVAGIDLCVGRIVRCLETIKACDDYNPGPDFGSFRGGIVSLVRRLVEEAVVEAARGERETCAQVADARADAARERHKRVTHPGDVNESEWLEATSIAAAIRARAAP